MYRNYEILVMRNEVVYKKLIMAPKFDEDDISGFKFDVLAGEYEFFAQREIGWQDDSYRFQCSERFNDAVQICKN